MAGVMIAKLAHGFFGGAQLIVGGANAPRDEGGEGALRVGKQQSITGIEEHRSQAQGLAPLFLRLRPAGRWNDSVQAQVNCHLPVMIESMPRRHGSDCEAGALAPGNGDRLDAHSPE